MVRFNLRQNPHRQAVRIQRFTIYFSRTASDGGWLDRSIGLIVPPPIPVGGAPYAVTHSRRKYHHPRMCLMASALPGAVCGAGDVRSFPPGAVPPFPVKISPRTCRLASHIRNVSARPIQLYVPEHPRQPLDRNTFSDRAPLPIDGKGPPAKYPVCLRKLRQAVSSPRKCAAWGRHTSAEWKRQGRKSAGGSRKRNRPMAANRAFSAS